VSDQHQHGVFFLIKLQQQISHGFGGAAVEIARGFIGDLSAANLDAGSAFIAGRTIETAATGSGSGSGSGSALSSGEEV